MLGHSPSNVTHEYILSSYHHVSLHLLIKLLRHASSFTILYKYRIKFLKNPRNWKLDGQGGGRHGARGPRWRHNLIWPRSSLRISRKQAEKERGRDLCSVTWPHAHAHAHARARVSVRPILSFPSFCLSLAPLPLSLSLSLPCPFFLRRTIPFVHSSHQHCSQVPLLAQPDGFHLGSRMEETTGLERFLFSAIPVRWTDFIGPTSKPMSIYSIVAH